MGNETLKSVRTTGGSLVTMKGAGNVGKKIEGVYGFLVILEVIVFVASKSLFLLTSCDGNCRKMLWEPSAYHPSLMNLPVVHLIIIVRLRAFRIRFLKINVMMTPTV